MLFGLEPALGLDGMRFVVTPTTADPVRFGLQHDG